MAPKIRISMGKCNSGISSQRCLMETYKSIVKVSGYNLKNFNMFEKPRSVLYFTKPNLIEPEFNVRGVKIKRLKLQYNLK